MISADLTSRTRRTLPAMLNLNLVPGCVMRCRVYVAWMRVGEEDSQRATGGTGIHLEFRTRIIADRIYRWRVTPFCWKQKTFKRRVQTENEIWTKDRTYNRREIRKQIPKYTFVWSDNDDVRILNWSRIIFTLFNNFAVRANFRADRLNYFLSGAASSDLGPDCSNY